MAKSSALKKQNKDAQRKLVVFSALAGSLTVTALLLQFLSPPPVQAQAEYTLFAPAAQPASSTRPLTVQDLITRVKAQPSVAWRAIYIHHSATADGDAQSLARGGQLGDHFVIGNGNLAGDGEVQAGVRWTNQLPAIAPAGLSKLDQGCISISLVGNLDRKAPSAQQMEQLGALVRTLQQQYNIPAHGIYFVQQANSAASIGQQFPMNQFRREVLGGR